MKSNGMQAAGKGFFAMIAAAMCLTAGSAVAQMQMNTPSAGICGCDNKQEVERYVQNVINDYQHRGIGCEEAKMYTGACISVYCSSCNDSAAHARCVQTASDYFLYASGYCQQQAVGQLTAFMPMR
jgi:hypothetical protein